MWWWAKSLQRRRTKQKYRMGFWLVTVFLCYWWKWRSLVTLGRLDKGQNRHGDASQDRSSVNTYTHTVRERERESDPMYPSSSSWLNESCCVGPIRTLYGGGCHTIIGSYVATICKEVRREKLKRESGGLYTHTQASAIVRRRCNLRINV